MEKFQVANNNDNNKCEISMYGFTLNSQYIHIQIHLNLNAKKHINYKYKHKKHVKNLAIFGFLVQIVQVHDPPNLA